LHDTYHLARFLLHYLLLSRLDIIDDMHIYNPASN